MTEYTLQKIAMPAGTVTFKLLWEFAGLTVPTFASLLFDSDEKTESIDLVAGEIELEQMSFAYIEDYSTYSEGFWRKVLMTGDTEIQVLIDEGSGNTVYFWGALDEDSVQHEELSLITNYVRRRGKFSCTSKILELQDYSCDDYKTDYSTHTISDAGLTFLMMVDLFAVMTAKLNGSYDTGDITFDGDEDFQYFDNGTAYYLADLAIHADVAGSYSLYTICTETTNVFRLLGAFCNDLCLIPRLYYDLSDSRWKMTLSNRGHCNVGAELTLTAPKVSTNVMRDPVCHLVQVRAHFQNECVYVLDGTAYHWTDEREAPAYITRDIDHTSFILGPHGPVSPYLQMYINDGADNMTAWTGIKYWNYATGAYSDTYDHWIEAKARYLWSVFGATKQGYERTYNGINSSILIGSTTTIDDGVQSKKLYAHSISRSLIKNECTVKWAEFANG